MSDALRSAIEKNGIKYAVVLSSVGADKSHGTGPVVGLHNLEKKLEGISGLNALFLRPGYFMENLLPQAGVIKSMGSMAGPVKEDLPLPMIASRDIGAFAAEALLKLDFAGKSTHELQGPRDVTYAEAAKIVGSAIGKADLTYKLAPAAQLKPVLMQMGMSSNMADVLLEMADALNSGYMKMLATALSSDYDSDYSGDFRSRSLFAGVSRKSFGRVGIGVTGESARLRRFLALRRMVLAGCCVRTVPNEPCHRRSSWGYPQG